MVAPLIPLYRLVLEKGSSHNAEHYHIIAAFTLQGQCTEQVVSGVSLLDCGRCPSVVIVERNKCQVGC